MPWTTPPLTQVVTAVQRAMTGRLAGADAALARNNLGPVAKVIAGELYALHQFAAWAVDQRFVLTCDADQLDRHGVEMKPPVLRKAAAAATGKVLLTSTGGATLDSGAVLIRSDGARYVALGGAIVPPAGTAEVSVAAELAGAAGSTDAGAVLTASTGLTGAADIEVGDGGLGGAADIEGDDAYRARLLFSKAYPEHGGAPADWLKYTLAVPGVTRAYIDPLGAGRGTVVVYPLFDGTRENGIGLESDRVAVETALRSAGPGAGLAVVRIPVARAIDVSITDMLPASPETQNAVALELAQTFAGNGRVAGYSEPHPSMPFLATAAKFSRSWVWQAVANTTGEESHIVAAPSADTVLAPGEIAVLGALSFA